MWLFEAKQTNVNSPEQQTAFSLDCTWYSPLSHLWVSLGRLSFHKRILVSFSLFWPISGETEYQIPSHPESQLVFWLDIQSLRYIRKGNRNDYCMVSGHSCFSYLLNIQILFSVVKIGKCKIFNPEKMQNIQRILVFISFGFALK